MRSFRVAMNQALSDYCGGHELAGGLEFWKLDGLEMKMLTRLLVAMMAAGVVIAGPIPATLAQTPPQRAVLAPLRMQLRDEIARMTSLRPNEIEVHTTHAVIRVVLINTVYNADPSSEREYLASTISALVRKNAETDPRYKPVAVLLVDFVKRGHWYTKTVESIEFRREANGTFARHTT